MLVNVAHRGFDNRPWASVSGVAANWAGCLAGKHQAWPRMAKSTWMATHDDGLIALLSGPDEVTGNAGAEGQTVTVTQQTEYRSDGTIRFTLKAAQPVNSPSCLRIPARAGEATVRSGLMKWTGKPETSLKLTRHPTGRMPFGGRGGFERVPLQQGAPIIALKAKARLVPEWTLLEAKNRAGGKTVPDMADVTQQSPVLINEPEVEPMPLGKSSLNAFFGFFSLWKFFRDD